MSVRRMGSHVVWKPQTPNIGMKCPLVISEWVLVWASSCLSEDGHCVDSSVEDGHWTVMCGPPTNQPILHSISRKVFKMDRVRMLAFVWQISN